MLNSIRRGVLGIWHAPVLVHPLLCGQDKGSNVHQDYDGEKEAVGKAIGPLSITRTTRTQQAHRWLQILNIFQYPNTP